MGMKIKMFTHTDLDGVGCAILLKRVYPDAEFDLCNYHEINDKVCDFYSSGQYEKYDKVFITDISVDQDVAKLIDLLDQDKKALVLLDHHATALWLNKYKWALVQVDQTDGSKTAGTSLLYSYFLQENLIDIDDWNTAQFVEKVRRYDTWEWHNIHKDNHAKELNDLLYIVGQNRFINRFIDDIDPDFKDSEQLLLEIEQKRIDAYVEKKRKELKKIDKDGFKFGVVFAETNQSIVGNILAEENPDLNAIVMLNPGAAGMSLRSIGDRMHVGEYLKFFYGGGGHANAAGAPLAEDLVWSWVNEVFDIKPVLEG